MAFDPRIQITFKIRGRGIDIDWRLWQTFEAYDAVEKGGRVFVEEQVNVLTRRKRRKITLPEGHPKRRDADA